MESFKISNNIESYKGTSICIVSDFKELNNSFVIELINGIKNFNKLDLLEISPERGNIKIAKIRELQEFLLYKPNYSDIKIVIINDIQNMKQESANAMLKIIEEPPKYAIIIATTNNWDNIITTIRSRLLKINIGLPKELYEKLSKKYENNIRYLNIFLKHDYKVVKYLLEEDKKVVEKIINDYIIEEKDFEFYMKNLYLENNEKNNIIIVISYYKILKFLFKLKEFEFIKKVEEITSIKEDVEKLEFLKNISKLGSILIRDTIVSKMSSKWKYMWNLNFIDFLGVGNYSFDVNCAIETLTYFNGIINSKVSNYNFNMEIFTHFIRLRQIYKK